MLFNTFQFLIFLVVAWAAYYAMPRSFPRLRRSRLQNRPAGWHDRSTGPAGWIRGAIYWLWRPNRLRLLVLFLASYYFYMCFRPWCILLIIYCTLVNYGIALIIEASSNDKIRFRWLVASLVLSLAPLAYFKYLNFAIDSINGAVAFVEGWLRERTDARTDSWWGWLVDAPGDESGMLSNIELFLPAGISFFTFQMLSYTIDVYRRHLRADRNLIRLATFGSFFPQLVAGPIERATNLLPQIARRHPLRYSHFQQAYPIILWGLFKKVVIADSLAAVVQNVYASPDSYSGPALMLATLFFAIQIYCDFSGYSDIAIGVARLFGIELMINFRQPYWARSISVFWQRWHISLTTWFRDYVYIPLGGNRVGVRRWAVNVFLVFLLSGLWHGANWTFVLWGFLHSLYFFMQRVLTPPIYRVVNAVKLYRVPFVLPFAEWSVTMSLVLVGWVFFRADSIDVAIEILKRFGDVQKFRTSELFNLGLPRFEFLMSFVWIAVLMGIDRILDIQPAWALKLWRHRWARLALLQVLSFAIVFFARLEGVQFIYFQF